MGTKNSLADALFSKSRQRVLALLYGQPYRSFNTNEVIRLSHVGTGAVQRELEKMTAVGLLTVKAIGNQRQYQANADMPFFSELHSIVIKSFGLAEVVKQALLPLAEQIQIAFIYGSLAKNADTAASDIDLMLVSNDLSYSDLFPHLQKVEPQLGRTINPNFYSELELTKKLKENNHFLNQVINQPKIFLIGTDDDLAKFR